MATSTTIRRASRWGSSERLIVLAAVVGVLHHTDHVLRYDHSGWPFRPEVSPFTFSLLAYPLLLGVLLLRGRPWWRVGLMAVVFLAVQAAHIFVEPPSHQYGTWARGFGTTPSGAHPPNLLHLASPAMGVVSVAISLTLSILCIATLASLIADARRQGARR